MENKKNTPKPVLALLLIANLLILVLVIFMLMDFKDTKKTFVAEINSIETSINALSNYMVLKNPSSDIQAIKTKIAKLETEITELSNSLEEVEKIAQIETDINEIYNYIGVTRNVWTSNTITARVKSIQDKVDSILWTVDNIPTSLKNIEEELDDIKRY